MPAMLCIVDVSRCGYYKRIIGQSMFKDLARMGIYVVHRYRAYYSGRVVDRFSGVVCELYIYIWCFTHRECSFAAYDHHPETS